MHQPVSRTKRRPSATRLAAVAAAILASAAACPGRAEDAPRTATAPVVLHDVVLDGLLFHHGGTTIAIRHVEARGTALTATDLRNILDPSSPLLAGQRLARLSAASIAMPEVEMRSDPDPGRTDGQGVTAHDVLLTGVEAGKAGTLSIGAIDADFQADAVTRAKATVGAMVAHRVDAALALAIATDKRDDASLPIAAIIADLSVAGARLAGGDEVTVSLDRLELGALEGRPLIEKPAAIVAIIGAAIDAASPAKERFDAAMHDARTSFRLGRLALSGLSLRDGAPYSFSLKAGATSLQGVEWSKIALVSLDDIAFASPQAQVTIKSLALSGIERGALYGRTLGMLTGMGLLDRIDEESPDVDSALRLADLHIAFPTVGSDLPFPPGTLNVVDVPALDAGDAVTKDGSHVSHAHVEVRYDLPTAGSDPGVQALRDAGLSHLDVSLGYRLTYDAAARDLRLDDLALDGRGLGAVTLSAHVGDLAAPSTAPRMTAEQLTAVFADSTFRDFAATVVDRGIIGTALPVMARRAGRSPALFKAGLKTAIDLKLPALLGQTPAATQVAAAVDGLLDAPGTLSLSVRSPAGMTFREIAATHDPAAIARNLDVEAQTRR